MAQDNDQCKICRGSLDGGYCRDADIFGCRPGQICFGCMNVPIRLPGWRQGDPKAVHSVEEMMEFGWDKREAKFHVKAVSRYLKIHAARSPGPNGREEIRDNEAGTPTTMESSEASPPKTA